MIRGQTNKQVWWDLLCNYHCNCIINKYIYIHFKYTHIYIFTIYTYIYIYIYTYKYIIIYIYILYCVYVYMFSIIPKKSYNEKSLGSFASSDHFPVKIHHPNVWLSGTTKGAHERNKNRTWIQNHLRDHA